MPKRALHRKSQLFSIPELNLQKFKFETQTQSIDGNKARVFSKGGMAVQLSRSRLPAKSYRWWLVVSGRVRLVLEEN